MKKIIVFDLDDTLFLTQEFKKELIKNFQKIGLPKKIFLKTYLASKKDQRYLGENYQIKLIKKIFPQYSFKKLKSVFEKTFEKAPFFVPEETFKILAELSLKYELILISFGEKNFQRKKIKSSGLEKFFKKIIISSQLYKISSFSRIFRKKAQIFFVEDNPSILKAIKKKFPKVITIWLSGENFNRKKKLKRDSFIDYHLQNLSQLLEVLKKIERKKVEKSSLK